LTNTVLDTNSVRRENIVRTTRTAFVDEEVLPVSTTTTAADQAAPVTGYPIRRQWAVLAVVLAVEVMDLLDATIINIAAPTIRTDLGASFSAVQWFAAGYTLAFAVLLMTGARLGDLIGRRRLFMIGIAGFTGASILSALAVSPGMLIATRALQGAFGAVLIPQGFGMIKEVFPADRMNKAFAAFGPVMGLSAVCGPIVAGALIDADLFGTGWRMLFLINLPLGLLAVFGAIRFMPESRPAAGQRLDLVGTVLAVGAAVLLIFPLVQGRDLGWPAWTFVLMVAALPVLALFVAYEKRQSSPLVELALFGRRAFSAGLVVITVFFGCLSGLMLVFGLYLQVGLGYAPLRAGLAFAPWAFGIAIGSTLAGAVLADRFGRLTLHAGFALTAAGAVWLAFAVSPSATILGMLPALLVCGIGCGLGLTPLFGVVLNGVRDNEVGTASGVLNAVQQFGGAAGVAALGTVFFSLLGHGHDFTDVMRRLLVVTVGLLATTAALAFLLPRQARAEEA
jgi:EmrB/QacA subfamily drug resistance transporter